MSTLREAAQQALEALDALEAPPSGVVDHYELDRRKQALRAALAQQAEPAPGWCKHCKQYSIEEPLPAQQAEPTQTPCDIAEDGVCEVIDCCGNPAQQAEPVAWIDDSGHPKHRLYLQSATEKRLYGPLRPLYTAPPQRKPLTEDEIAKMYAGCKYGSVVELARSIERAHGIGGDDGQA